MRIIVLISILSLTAYLNEFIHPHDVCVQRIFKYVMIYGCFKSQAYKQNEKKTMNKS